MSPEAKKAIYLSDYLKKNALFWPITWLIVATGVAAALRNEQSEISNGARTLVYSALLYSGAYLLVGVAADTRYHYWSILAIQTGAILALGSRPWAQSKRAAIATGIGLGLALLAAYAFRVLEVDLFLH